MQLRNYDVSMMEATWLTFDHKNCHMACLDVNEETEKLQMLWPYFSLIALPHKILWKNFWGFERKLHGETSKGIIIYLFLWTILLNLQLLSALLPHFIILNLLLILWGLFAAISVGCEQNGKRYAKRPCSSLLCCVKGAKWHCWLFVLFSCFIDFGFLEV